jgi:hypothetical protein
MTSLRYECDCCEEPRYTAQVKQCIECEKRNIPRFIGYCCLAKHAALAHPGLGYNSNLMYKAAQ